MATVAQPRSTRNQRERRLVAALVAACLLAAAGIYAWAYGPAYVAYWNYAPREGDILFQSLPPSRLVSAIEGATASSFSHCGIVSRQGGQWLVYEAYRGVQTTPLREFVFRGRNHGFAVYRLKDAHQQCIPATITHVQSYLGRPYDVRYRMDDDAIYCSELIYKAYRDASSGELLGHLDRLGDLNWRPYESTIRHYEGGQLPLDREMITPKAMALAPQLELVYRYGIVVPGA